MSIIKFLTGISGQSIVLPFYHVVSDKSLAHIKHLYPVKSVKEFCSSLEFLLKEYEPIDIQVLFELNKENRKPKKPSFHLTFDDGLREIYEIVLPILVNKGIPATIFINSAFIDNRDLFYRYHAGLVIEKYLSENKLTPDFQEDVLSVSYSDKERLYEYVTKAEVIDFLEKEQPYLTTEQVRDISEKGFSIGAHSIDHPVYYKESIDEQARQTIESLAFINSIIKQKIQLFAFPFTDYEISKAFFERVKPYVDLSFGTAGIKKDEIINNLQRIPAESSNSKKGLKNIFIKEYLAFIVKCCCGKGIIHRK